MRYPEADEPQRAHTQAGDAQEPTPRKKPDYKQLERNGIYLKLDQLFDDLHQTTGLNRYPIESEIDRLVKKLESD
jgi:hypothetical protein